MTAWCRPNCSRQRNSGTNVHNHCTLSSCAAFLSRNGNCNNDTEVCHAMTQGCARRLHAYPDIQVPPFMIIKAPYVACNNPETSLHLVRMLRIQIVTSQRCSWHCTLNCTKSCCFGCADATPSGNRRNLSASWNAFSCGPHNCIGQALALAETRTALAVLLANFQFDLLDGFSRRQYLKCEQVWRITLQPSHGLPLVVTPILDSL